MTWKKPKLEVLEVGMEIGAYRSPRPSELPKPTTSEDEAHARPEPPRDH